MWHHSGKEFAEDRIGKLRCHLRGAEWTLEDRSYKLCSPAGDPRVPMEGNRVSVPAHRVRLANLIRI